MRKRRLLAGLKPSPEKVALPVAAKPFTGPVTVPEQLQPGSVTSTHDGRTTRIYDDNGNVRIEFGLLPADDAPPVASARYDLTLDVNGNVSGFESVSEGSTANFGRADTLSILSDAVNAPMPFAGLDRARVMLDPVAEDWRIYAYEESREVSYTDVMGVDGSMRRVATTNKRTCKFTVRDRAIGSTGSRFRVDDLLPVLVGDHLLRLEERFWKAQRVERYSPGVYDFYCDEIVPQRS